MLYYTICFRPNIVVDEMSHRRNVMYSDEVYIGKKVFDQMPCPHTANVNPILR